MIAEIRTEARNLVGAVSSRQVKNFFTAKGYTVCNITPITNSSKWFAILVKNREYIIATVFTSKNRIERFEESVM